MTFPLFPPEASVTAQQVDALFSYLMAVCGLFLTGIVVIMTYWLIKYRRGHPVYRRQRKISSTPFEIAWTVVPFLFFMSFFAWGANVYFQMHEVPPGALEIHVIGKQWMWTFQHPEGNREMNELHVPVGRAVKLVLATEDVIHSLFLPAFRIKQEVVPGRYSMEWFRAIRTGSFPIYCAEYCGADHSLMIGRVIVMTPSDYEAWLTSGGPTEPIEASGERLYRELGCSGCHSGSSIVRAPPLEGLYGKPVPLSNGQVVTADAKYLHDSILYPGEQIVAGYIPVMPSYQGQVTEGEVFELIAYLKSISTKAAVARPPNLQADHE